MKRLRLNENLILREAMRTIDRVKNEMFVFLSIEPLFGAAYTPDIAKATTREQFYVSAAMNHALWDLNKDSTQQEFVVNIFGFLDCYYPTVMDYFAWKDAAECEIVENPIPNGDPITQLKPFAGQPKINALRTEKVMGEDFLLFRTLYDKGVRTFTLEDV